MASPRKPRPAKPKRSQLKTAVATETTRPERKRAEPTAPERRTSGASRPLLLGRWQTNAVTFLLLTLATLALYAGDLHLGFFRVDDPQYVVNDPWIRGITVENLRHILGAPYFANYSPLHVLSYMVDYAFGGLNAYAFHLSSNLWAGVVAGLVYLVALALTGRRIVAVAAALLFVVHPAHVEAVAWISSRKDLVAAAFALPSLLAYLRYREGGVAAAKWYIASLLLFLLAVSGKLSVATFPAVFLAHDLFVERRKPGRSLADKVPFLVAAGFIALVAASAQPPTGHRTDAYVVSVALGESLWLLTGFGRYVIYRVPPDEATTIAVQVVGAALLLAVFAVPLLLRRYSPMAVVLAYWILFGYLPSQVLSFTHPVTDRYLYFPSVAAVILIAWGVIVGGERLGRRGLVGAAVLLAVVGVLWGRGTLAYLSEWSDSRSVWYAATGKSSDPDLYYNLGWHYLDKAARLGAAPRASPLTEAEAHRLASSVSEGDPRLAGLLGEWGEGQRGGPVEKAFQDHLRALAWDDLDRALLMKGRRVMPDLYFHRGLILLDGGDLQGARKEFLTALDEASRSRFTEGREQIMVNSHNDLGIVAWREGDYREALRWLQLAEEEQTRFGGNWVPDLTENRKRLEVIIASLPTR